MFEATADNLNLSWFAAAATTSTIAAATTTATTAARGAIAGGVITFPLLVLPI